MGTFVQKMKVKENIPYEDFKPVLDYKNREEAGKAAKSFSNGSKLLDRDHHVAHNQWTEDHYHVHNHNYLMCEELFGSLLVNLHFVYGYRYGMELPKGKKNGIKKIELNNGMTKNGMNNGMKKKKIQSSPKKVKDMTISRKEKKKRNGNKHSIHYLY